MLSLYCIYCIYTLKKSYLPNPKCNKSKMQSTSEKCLAREDSPYQKGLDLNSVL